MLTRTIVATITAALLTPVAGPARPQTGGERHCQAASDAQRRVWQTRDPVREQPALGDGTQVRHWPSATLGTWIVELTGPQRDELAKVTPSDITRIVFDAHCQPATHVAPREGAMGRRFNDHDLAARVRSGGRGVVYLWSPHMPLSVDAIAAMTLAAGSHGLAIDLVLDPAADRAFAARIARERALPHDALRVADSVELSFRDALVHAPTVLVYASGAIAGSVYPGGHTEGEYAAYFARVLSARH